MSDSPMAIVGLSYRAPGVGRKGLWEYLAEAKVAWSKVPAHRFDQDAYYYHDSEKPGCISSQGAHFLLEDPYCFDAAFFNMRAEEARAVDPQHRMMLECVLEAAESAGWSLLDLAGSDTGVFSAVGATEYGQHIIGDPPTTSTWSAAGNALCMFANRLSYFFDLNGPSMSLDAACASSAYAIHMACQSLRAGECKTAVISASALLLGPNGWSMLDTMGALSQEGRSYSYDARASGFGRGEGGAALFVKRLDDAIKDGDPVHAVIRNSACNHVGRSEGITMPKRASQEQVLRKVHNDIGLNPSKTPVVEGHGTGTQVGDPIEAGAFSTVLAHERTESNPLYIGSLKSNFGHLEGASGILAVIKAILMVQKETILPSAGFEEMNKTIEGKEKMRVARTTVPWPLNSPKRVCVTNFGFGGSNSAVIIEETKSMLEAFDQLTNGTTLANRVSNGVNGNNLVDLAYPQDATKRLFVLSAKSERSLTSYMKSFSEYLDASPKSSRFLNNLSYTLAERRTHYTYRIAVVASSVNSIQSQLSANKASKIRDRTLAYTFTGQGAQYAQMATSLRCYSTFVSAIDQASSQLCEMGSSWSLKEELGKPDSQSRIHDAEISQPACTAIQLALVLLLKSWGVHPAAVTGHSSGEIAAAFAANLISFQTALAVAYFRGQAASKLIRDQTQKGAMLAIGLSSEEALSLLEQNATGYATVAAINDPHNVTISGDEPVIEDLHRTADTRGIFARRLKVQVAYHSRHLKQVADSYLNSIKPFCGGEEPLSRNKGTENVVFVSSVTGQIMEHIDASYWVQNLVQSVRFADAMRCLLLPLDQKARANYPNARTPDLIVELGPHAALKNSIKQTVDRVRQHGDQRLSRFAYLPSLTRGIDSDEALLTLAGGLYTLGHPIELGKVNRTNINGRKVLTDLPAYEWDKSVRYVHTGRIMQDTLFPGQPYHPLLGWKYPSHTASEHVFRQVFTLDQLPWIRDHKVGGRVLFPMTGYMSMAMEALRRLRPSAPPNIAVRDYYIKQGLEIQEDERVDITTTLRPAATGSDHFSSSSWYFEISSWSETNAWTMHCYGRVEPENNEISAESQAMKESAKLITSDRLVECDVESKYAKVRDDGGLDYGPTFRPIIKLWEGPNCTVLETELKELILAKYSPHGSPATIDPPAMDGMAPGPAFIPSLKKKGMLLLPKHVTRLRISNSMPANDRQRFTVVSRMLCDDFKAGNISLSMVAFAQCSGRLVPVAEWESMEFQALNSPEIDDATLSLPSSYRWDLMPSLDFAEPEERRRMVADIPVDETELRVRHQFTLASAYYMDRALKETAEDDMSKMAPNHRRFIYWAKNILERVSLESVSNTSTLLSQVSNTSARGEMICAVGESLVQILRGEIQPLEVLLKDDLLARNYEADTEYKRCCRVLAKGTRCLAEAQPGLKVLEVGAGTGSATMPVLQELSRGQTDSSLFSSYTFTDISAGFFEQARINLAKWSNRIIYKKLDIGKSPVQQGFTAGEYDLVIASNAIHATPDMTATIDNIRTLLKPNGKLALVECIRHPAFVLPFAILPDWWLAEDSYRDPEEGPLLSETSWNRLFSDRGFSGLDYAIQDFPGDVERLFSVLWSTKVGTQQGDVEPVTICGPLMDNEEEEFDQIVADQVSDAMGCLSSVKPYTEMDFIDDPFCIFVDSPQNSVLSDMTPETFETLKNTLLETRGLLWVIPADSSPDAESIRGLLRSLRIENGSKVWLLFEKVPRTLEGAAAITKIAKQLQDADLAQAMDHDFVWHNNMIHMPRLREMPTAKDVFAFDAGVVPRSQQRIGQGDGALALAGDAAGSPDSIYFHRTDVALKDVGPEEILVRMEATGMNFRDCLLVLGSIPWTTPGFEGAGVVVGKGANVANLQLEDRVFFTTPGGGSYSSYIRMQSWRACKIPDGLSTTDAASIMVAYSTAFMSVTRIGRLRKGESILIHAASGAVGQACIVLAQNVGADVFATAGNATKRQFLHETFGIPSGNIFSSRTPEFRDGILCATNGKGVDVAVNSLSGNLLQETWSLMADFGRFVEIGKRDLLQNSYLGMKPFDRNVTFSGVDLRTLFENRPEEMKDCLAELMSMLHQGVIVPIRPVTVFSVSNLATGLRKLQSGQNIGKIVITWGLDDSVLAESPPPLSNPPGQMLKSEVTYVITGGTSGIGLSLASWMIDNGACNVVLLGRSGSSRQEVKNLLKRHERTNVQVRAIACNVGVLDELAQALDAVKDLPPVRGIIHGALNLQDALFENATFDHWKANTGPRVQAAWYLEELLPDLDFFIVLASFLGAVGNAGQSIYAGTASFFDAFSERRNARGQRTVSIALPVVTDVGYVADRDLTTKLKDSLGATLTDAQIKTIIKNAILGPPSGPPHNGKAISFSFALGGHDRAQLPWQTFHPKALVQLIKDKQQRKNSETGNQDSTTTNATKHSTKLSEINISDPLLALLEALSTKVSSITMIERDDVEPDAPLSNYGLDSLVSVELRNWIRRETGVELALSAIGRAENLRALAGEIVGRREMK